MTVNLNGHTKVIPDETIHKVYKIYRGGGITTFLASGLGWAIWSTYYLNKPENAENLSAGLGAIKLGIILIPSSLLLGSTFGNFRVLLYEKNDLEGTKPNYSTIIENVPKTRRKARKVSHWGFGRD